MACARMVVLKKGRPLSQHGFFGFWRCFFRSLQRVHRAGCMRARYTVDSDCLGSAIYPDGEKSATFVSPDGSTFVYTVIDASGDQSTVLSGTQVRVSP